MLFSINICSWLPTVSREGNGTPLQCSCLENPMDRGAWWATVHGVAKSRTQLSDFTFTFQFHALEKEMAAHSSIRAWRIPGMGEPGGLPSMGSHRVGHDWCDLAAAAANCWSATWAYFFPLVASVAAAQLGLTFPCHSKNQPHLSHSLRDTSTSQPPNAPSFRGLSFSSEKLLFSITTF